MVTPDRAHYLDAANTAINGSRARDYGSAQENFQRTADMWTAFKGITFTATDVAAFLAILKLSRIANTPAHEDSWIDLVGYAALGGEVSANEN